ncbi:hypothetical protein B4100_2132 [Heyndrickxia coagulans]|nr:hypothetical protein B4100_2132 [Heyndrickxia coagulans]
MCVFWTRLLSKNAAKEFLSFVVFLIHKFGFRGKAGNWQDLRFEFYKQSGIQLAYCAF